MPRRVVLSFCKFAAAALIVATLTTTFASAQGVFGALNWQVRTTQTQCLVGKQYQNVYTYTLTSFVYTPYQGTSEPVSGAAQYVHSPGGPNCPAGGPKPTSLGLSPTTPPGVAIHFIPEDLGQGSITTTLTGYVDPKYLVVGVTYAPPGPSTNTFVQYLNSTFVGNTESLSTSFTNSNMGSVTITYGPSIPGVANAKISNTFSETNSEMTKSTSTVTTSIQVQQGEKTFGTGNYFAPVDNDYDIIWVWLNPVAIFTTSSVAPLAWNGYGYDTTDQNGMDIVGIQLGYLNGHFGSMPPDIQSSINRVWAADQTWAAGQGPALTNADLAQIASADPFSVSTYGSDDIGYVPPSPQTPDNRFTLSLCSQESSFSYLQAAPSTSPEIYTCNLTYTNLSTQAQEISTTFSLGFSTDESFSGTGFLKNFSADLKDSYTLTWTTDAQSSITTSTTSTANLSAQGPPCNNAIQGQGPCIPVYDSSGNQPTQFDVYEDNMYGTFMFAPVHYY
jgi:hypothetical protein